MRVRVMAESGGIVVAAGVSSVIDEKIVVERRWQHRSYDWPIEVKAESFIAN